MFESTYNTISAPVEGVFKDKGSRFIGLAYPVESENQAKEIVALVRKKYHDATHHCYAYWIGHHGTPAVRMNDDGEPSSTAGKPIYGQILSHDLKDVLIIVVRYFGGIKLGVSGLINAYKETAKITLANAKIITLEIKTRYKVSTPYAVMNTVMQVLKHPKVEIIVNNGFEDRLEIEFLVVVDVANDVIAQLEKIFGVKIIA